MPSLLLLPGDPCSSSSSTTLGSVGATFGAGEGAALLLLIVLSCWRAHMDAYSPPAATSAAWLPLSTT